LQVHGKQGSDELTNTYTYENAGNLTEAKSADCDINYQYDATCNITQETDAYTGGSTYLKECFCKGNYFTTLEVSQNGILQNTQTHYSDSDTGRLGKMDYSNEYNITYSYDDNGNLLANNETSDGATKNTTYNIYTYNLANFATEFTGAYSTSSQSATGLTENHVYKLGENLISDPNHAC
jgi:hypothetical protein